jgi:hypothetical protein
MANNNEFIARKGLIVQKDSTFSGSSKQIGSFIHDSDISTDPFLSGFAGYGSSLYLDNNDK